LLDKKGLRLDIDIAADVSAVVGDARRVEQILLNLLSNAVKFTEHGSVKLTCRCEHGAYVTTVTDSGIGISTSDQATLFAPFHQIDTGLNRRYEGTGLGLSICKRLVEMMGGQIWVESIPGVGSTFSFSLPIMRKAS